MPQPPTLSQNKAAHSSVFPEWRVPHLCVPFRLEHEKIRSQQMQMDSMRIDDRLVGVWVGG